MLATLRDYLDVLTDFFESPSEGARQTAERPLVGLGVLCFLLSGSTLVVAQALRGGSALYLFKLLPWGAVLAISGLLPLLTGFLLAGVFHLTAEFLGAKRGSALAMFVLLGVCQLVYILYLPVVLTTEILVEEAALWRAVALFALGAVSLYLKLTSIRANYGFSTGKAGAVLVLPYTGMLLAAAVAVAAMLGSALSLGNLLGT